ICLDFYLIIEQIVSINSETRDVVIEPSGYDNPKHDANVPLVCTPFDSWGLANSIIGGHIKEKE
ncbi:MAG TPA: hypothetical protein VHT73_13630, partial [Thermodesulfobacteriota bacterium]|nr:hypothetical protein [Thermodesulfobacteriota bacterium]